MGQAEIADQVSMWRRSLGLTQAQLEEKAGLSHNAVSRIERGNHHPQLATIYKLAKAMGISTEQLQFGKPPEKARVSSREPFRARLMADVQGLDEEKCKRLYPLWERLLELLEDADRE